MKKKQIACFVLSYITLKGHAAMGSDAERAPPALTGSAPSGAAPEPVVPEVVYRCGACVNSTKVTLTPTFFLCLFFLPTPKKLFLPASSALPKAHGVLMTMIRDDDPARSKAELWAYNGADSSKPLLLGCKGLVFDVSAGRDFYGPQAFI